MYTRFKSNLSATAGPSLSSQLGGMSKKKTFDGHLPVFAASRISGVRKRGTVRYRRQYIHTCRVNIDFIQIEVKKRKTNHQGCFRCAGETDLPALQPDVLQLVIHSTVTAETGEEASKTGST